MEISFTFLGIASAILKLFIIAIVGYSLYRFRIIDDKFTDTLSLLLIRVIFPALIISTTISYFDFKSYNYWWVLPLSGALFSLAGTFLGSVVYRFLPSSNLKKEFIASSGFQNCGYLPMNLILFAFSGLQAEKLLIYMFLFIIGFDVLMWSFVPLFLSGKLRREFKLEILFNPPVIAILFSLLWIACFGKNSMPEILMHPVSQLGRAAFPLAMVTLGAYLARYRSHDPQHRLLLGVSGVIKLILFPALFLILLKFLPIDMSYKFFLFLESMMPTAVSLVVIGSYTGANNKFFSDSIFYTHLAAFFTIPIWLAIFKVFIPH